MNKEIKACEGPHQPCAPCRGSGQRIEEKMYMNRFGQVKSIASFTQCRYCKGKGRFCKNEISPCRANKATDKWITFPPA